MHTTHEKIFFKLATTWEKISATQINRYRTTRENIIPINQ